TGPVITENFEREMDAALNVNHSSIDLEPYQSEEDEYDVENSIEPHIEQEKAQTADDDVRAWLSSSRVSTADMLAEDDEREGRKREEFKQVE
ncbi:hypothetical protein OFM81_28550, partial [Escherichia coli]|nr:hypothetical protein [Escherichia coli]